MNKFITNQISTNSLKVPFTYAFNLLLFNSLSYLVHIFIACFHKINCWIKFNRLLRVLHWFIKFKISIEQEKKTFHFIFVLFCFVIIAQKKKRFGPSWWHDHVRIPHFSLLILQSKQKLSMIQTNWVVILSLSTRSIALRIIFSNFFFNFVFFCSTVKKNFFFHGVLQIDYS